MQRIYFRLDWREYFKTNSKQIKKYSKTTGIVLYRKLYKDVKFASTKKVKEHIIALDDNTRTVISVPSKDFIEVLNECQQFLEKVEDYESCAEIRDTLIKIQSTPPKRKPKEAEKLLLIKPK